MYSKNQIRYMKLGDKIWKHHQNESKFKRLEKFFRVITGYAFKSGFSKPSTETVEKLALEFDFYGIDLSNPDTVEQFFTERERLVDRMWSRINYLGRIQKQNNVSGLQFEKVQWGEKSINVLGVIPRMVLTTEDEQKVIADKLRLVKFFLDVVESEGLKLWSYSKRPNEYWQECNVDRLKAYIPFSVIVDLYTLDDTLYLSFGESRDQIIDESLSGFNLNGQGFAVSRDNGYPLC